MFSFLLYSLSFASLVLRFDVSDAIARVFVRSLFAVDVNVECETAEIVGGRWRLFAGLPIDGIERLPGCVGPVPLLPRESVVKGWYSPKILT